MENRIYKKCKTGFTLIELLVVISVVSLLASLIVVALKDARVKARDVKRQADLKQISTAIELYYDKYSQYPQEGWCDSSIGSCGHACPCEPTEDNWNYLNPAFIGLSLRNANTMKNLPKDPLNNTSYYYDYEPDCNQGRCPSPMGCCWYRLRARLEQGGNHDITGGG